MAGWLDSAGASDPLFVRSGGDNNQWEIVTDPTINQQVLLAQVFGGNNEPSQINTPLYPTTNQWLEMVVRIDPNDGIYFQAGANGEVIDDFGFISNSGLDPGGGPYAFVETDFGVVCPGGVPFTGCGSGGAFAWPAGRGQGWVYNHGGINMADDSYHTSGGLAVASVAQKTMAICAYMDNLPSQAPGGSNCYHVSNNGSGQSPDICADTNSVACYQSGSESIGSYATQVSGGTVRQWIQRLTIWTCPNWNAPPNSNSSGTGCDSGIYGIPTHGASGPAWQ
jgi:hypothetical protein